MENTTGNPQPKKKNKLVLGALGCVGLLFICGIIAASTGMGGSSSTKNNTNNSSQNESTQTTETKKEETTIKIGQPARDGKFEFTVASVECGKTSVGTNQYLTKQAQGQFCLMNVTVKNIGDQAQIFDSSSQYLYDAGNAKYSADGVASMYANPQGGTFLNQINPGNSVSGILVFDMAKDKTPMTAELHDSPFSNGIKISLK